MTFVKTDLLRILEEVLPARFGGASTDYQLVEESRDGLTSLTLLVSPRVGEVDEDLVRRTFLEHLGRGGASERLMARAWERARAVTIARHHPRATKAGKILPFHLLGDGTLD